MYQQSLNARSATSMRLSGTHAAPARPGYRRGMVLFAGVAALATVTTLGAVAAWPTGGTPDHAEHAAARRRVNVTQPERAVDGQVTLPATLQPYQATDVYARVGGYLKAWKVDIGDRVKAGQVLAVIDTPELDQELMQAEALLEQGRSELVQARAEREEAQADLALAEANAVKAKAHHDFAASALRRDRTLVTGRSISQQDFEQSVRNRDAQGAEWDATKADARRKTTGLATRDAIIGSRAATVRSREANVRRLRELQGFKTVTAPFDGVITRRGAEVGILVTAGSTGTRPLFGIAQDDVLRVQVQVPQSFAARTRAGDKADVKVPEYPARPFPATIARTARAVDVASRTLLVELELPNPGAVLLPGTYAQVHLAARRTDGTLMVAANALLFRSDGPHVAVVTGGGTVRLQPVGLGRDHGSKVEVLTGLHGTEVLVLNPTDDLRDGEQVETIVPPPAAAAKH